MKFIKQMISGKSPEDDTVNIEDVAAMIDDVEADEAENEAVINSLASIQSKLKGLQSESERENELEDNAGSDGEHLGQVSNFEDLIDEIKDPDQDEVNPEETPLEANVGDQDLSQPDMMTEDDFSRLDDELAELSEDANMSEAQNQSPEKNELEFEEDLEAAEIKPDMKFFAERMVDAEGDALEQASESAQTPEPVATDRPSVFSAGPRINRPRANSQESIEITEKQGGAAMPEEKMDVPEPTPNEPLILSLPEKVLPEPKPRIVEVPAPAAGRARRRAGRVKTRLLGFEHSDGTNSNPFDAETKVVPTSMVSFPVGWIVVIEGPGLGNAFSLFNGVSKIGRGEDQAIKLDFGDSSISRDNHAAIAYDSEQHEFFLGHGGKANLVRLNDKPVLSTEEVTNGDIIRIGETKLRFVALCGAEFNWDEAPKEEEDDASNT
ncbi:MAG: FHA domain-containing protein [Paracoccaceae bacterium]